MKKVKPVVESDPIEEIMNLFNADLKDSSARSKASAVHELLKSKRGEDSMEHLKEVAGHMDKSGVKDNKLGKVYNSAMIADSTSKRFPGRPFSITIELG